MIRFFRKYKTLSIWFCSALISFALNAPPIPAQITKAFNKNEWTWLVTLENESTGFDIPEILKTRFPFDLIYPVNPQDLNIDSQCLKTTLWGKERDFCAPMQITKTAKDLFLLQFVLRSLLSL